MNAAGRRELQRCVLEALVTMRGSGWASAGDIASRMQVQDRDGRRVAGALRRLHAAGYVERLDFRSVVEKFRRGRAPGLALAGPSLDYRITDAGAEHLAQLQHEQPRLTDQVRHSWPRPRHPQRQRHGR